MADVQTTRDVIASMRAIVGSYYHLWTGGALGNDEPAYVNPGPYVNFDYVRQNGIHCAGLLNFARWWNNLPTVGGTEAYGNFLTDWEPYVPGKPIEVGKVLYGGYVNVEQQGHVAVVSTPPDEYGNQYCIQSDMADDYTTYNPGVNEKRTVAESAEMFGMPYVGVMPDVGYVPFGEADGGIVPHREILPHGAISVDELMAIMPNNLSGELAVTYLPHLCQAMWEANITSVARKAAFLANLAHESAELYYFEEIADGSAYEWRQDLGNVYAGDGMRYKGRGPIQLTGRANYRAAGAALGLDLEGNPELVATPEVGFRTTCWYWTSRSLNAYADAGNLDMVIYLINGGYNGYDERWAYYRAALNGLSPYNQPGGDIVFETYNLCAAPDKPFDKALANAAKAAMDQEGISCTVQTNSENIRAASLAAYWGPTGKWGCLVIGYAAHEHLHPLDQPFDRWENGVDTWKCWDDDRSDEGALKIFRNNALAWIAERESKPGLIERFDKILKATNPQCEKALNSLSVA